MEPETMHVELTHLEGVEVTLQDVLTRMAAMEASIHSRIDALASEIGVHVTTLEARFDARFQELENRQGATKSQLTILVNNQFATEHNFRAKQRNAATILQDHRGPLVALVSRSTGIEIPSFPKNLKSIDRLTQTELRAILHALKVPTAGLDHSDLRDVLRREIM